MIKHRVWEIVEPAKAGDKLSHAFDIFLITLILLNVSAVIIGSVQSVQRAYGPWFYAFEVLSVAIFTVEYIARIWSCSVTKEYQNPLTGRLHFAVKPFPIIDLIAILPFYLPFVGVDLRVMRALRIVRLLRILKLARYTRAMTAIRHAIVSKKEELILTTVVLFLLLVISSSLMYYVEHDAQPEAFPDIPAAMWWAVVTLTTVGYGDVFPVTTIGKALAAIIAVLGIGMVALPTGILGASFVEAIEHSKEKDNKKACPHCGKEQ
jgi:voltage-gated potassium channel